MYVLQQEIRILTCISVLAGVLDLRRRQIPVSFFMICAVIGIAVCTVNRREAASVFAAMVPGVLLVLFSVCTEGGIGIGDGHFLMTAALFLNWKEVTVMTVLSFLMAAAVSLGMILYGICAGKNMKRKSLPFLAFMPVSLLLMYGF